MQIKKLTTINILYIYIYICAHVNPSLKLMFITIQIHMIISHEALFGYRKLSLSLLNDQLLFFFSPFEAYCLGSYGLGSVL